MGRRASSAAVATVLGLALLTGGASRAQEKANPAATESAAAQSSAAAPRADEFGGSLDEAYYLARCAQSGWEDVRSYTRLMDSARSERRKAMYLRAHLNAVGNWGMEGPLIVGPSFDDGVSAWLRTLYDQLKGVREAGFLALVSSARQEDANLPSDLAYYGDQGVPLMMMLLNDTSSETRIGAASAMSTGWKRSARPSEALPFLAARVLLDGEENVALFSAEAIRNLTDVPWREDLSDAELVAAAREWVVQHYDVSVLPGHEAEPRHNDGEEGNRQSLREAYYLAKCVESAWLDTEAYTRLLDSCEQDGRRALYMVSRTLACWKMSREIDNRLIAIPPADLRKAKLASFVEDRATKEALDSMRPAAFLAWASQACSSDAHERWRAASNIAQMYEQDGAVDLLIMMLNDNDGYVRVGAVPPETSDPEVVKSMAPFLAVRVLCDPSPVIQSGAAQVLGRIVGEDFDKEDRSFLAPGRATPTAATKWILQHYDASILDKNSELDYWDLVTGKAGVRQAP
jgi:hypothetical protein